MDRAQRQQERQHLVMDCLAVAFVRRRKLTQRQQPDTPGQADCQPGDPDDWDDADFHGRMVDHDLDAYWR